MGEITLIIFIEWFVIPISLGVVLALHIGLCVWVFKGNRESFMMPVIAGVVLLAAMLGYLEQISGVFV